MNLAALVGVLLLATVIATDLSSLENLEDDLEDLDNDQYYDEENIYDISAESRQTYPHVLLKDASFDADKELMDAIREIGSITCAPIPIYRDDLPRNYIAYWSVELNNDQYVVISTGSATGDYRLPIQGPLPSMVTIVNRTAATYGKTCDKFYMMTPSGEIMCKDVNGHIVATSTEKLLSSTEEDDDPMFEYAHNRLETSLGTLQLDWNRRAKQVESDNIWTSDEESKNGSDSSFAEFAVSPGDVISLPVGGAAISMKLRYVPEDARAVSRERIDETQLNLCRTLSPCNPDNPTDVDLSQAQKTNGVTFIALKVRENCADIIGNVHVHFEIEVVAGSLATKRRYSLQCGDETHTRKRRATNSTKTVYKRWSRWRTKGIPINDKLFPEYRQHRVENKGWKLERRTIRVIVNHGWNVHTEHRIREYNVSTTLYNCTIDSAPVAWAMVFGYLDRRSHANPDKYGNGSFGLFRCGDEGTEGDDSCVAPATCDNSTRIAMYIEAIAKSMDALCKDSNGSTSAIDMTKVKNFFVPRQKSGVPRLKVVSKTWRTNRKLYSKMRRYSYYFIRHRIPVVVGTQEGVELRHHYSVATTFRFRVRRFRVCTKVGGVKTCPRKWRRQKEVQFYTHRGAGGIGNRWQPFDFRYIAAALY